jgi:molecular chaperone GrpE
MAKAAAQGSDNVALEPEERERLQSDVQREHDLYQRAVADFESYRRRVERDRIRNADRDKRDLLLPLLDVMDGFDRARPYLADAPAPVAEVLQAIQRRLADLLSSQGVQRVQTVGEPFDPAAHEAIGVAPSDAHPPGTVTEEMQPGYRLGDELLRPARVRVAPSHAAKT